MKLLSPTQADRKPYDEETVRNFTRDLIQGLDYRELLFSAVNYLFLTLNF